MRASVEGTFAKTSTFLSTAKALARAFEALAELALALAFLSLLSAIAFGGKAGPVARRLAFASACRLRLAAVRLASAASVGQRTISFAMPLRATERATISAALALAFVPKSVSVGLLLLLRW